jgi:Zn-dependent protease with chaperone function
MTGIDEARSLLPTWVVWGPLLLTVPLAFLVALVFSWLGTALALRPLARAGGAFWVERARLAYPGAVVAARTALLLPLLFGVVFLLLPGGLCPVPSPALAALVALASFTGGRVVAHHAQSRIHPGRLTLADKLRAEATVWLYFGIGLVALIAAALCMPPHFDWRAAALVAIAAAGMTFSVTGCGFLFVRAAGLAWPARPRLQAVVGRATERSGAAHPRAVYEIALPVANAWVLPFLGVLLYTPRILDVLADEELEVVTAHELAHLSEPWQTLLGRVLPLYLLVPLTATFPLLASIGVAGVLAVEGVAVAGLVFVNWLSRRMERRADEAARAGEDEAGIYARALARAYEANLAPAVSPGSGGTHPHLYDRLLAAGIQPEFDRPSPPSRWRVSIGLSVSVGLPVALLLAGLVAGLMVYQDERLLHLALALRGGNARNLSDLAQQRFLQREWAAAATLYRAAGEIDGVSPWYPANEAIALAREGRCDESEAAAREARRRYEARPPSAEAARVVDQAWQAVAWCRMRHGATRP